MGAIWMTLKIRPFGENMFNLLSVFDKRRIGRNPCEFAVGQVDDVVSLPFCREFPDYRQIFKDSPSPGTLRWPAMMFLRDDRLSLLWQDFWQVHLSGDFLEEVLEFWREDLHKIAPKILSLDRTPGIRGIGSRRPLNFEGQFVWNLKPGTHDIIEPHCDNFRTLVYILWYLRSPEDSASGGNFQFHSFIGAPKFTDGRFTLGELRTALTVPYKRGSVVMVLNTLQAVHSVSPRVGATLPRCHVVVNLEVSTTKLRG